MGNNACCATPIQKPYDLQQQNLVLKRAPTSTDLQKLIDKFYSQLDGQIAPQSSIYAHILSPDYLRQYTQLLRNNYVQHWHAHQVISMVLRYMESSKEYSVSQERVKPDHYVELVRGMANKFKWAKGEVSKLGERFEAIIRKVGCQQIDGEIKAKRIISEHLVYDLSEGEVEHIMENAQRASVEDPRAFCLLTNYLVKCCLNLQQKGRSISQIETKYKEALRFLNSKLDTQYREFDREIELSQHKNWKNDQYSTELVLDLTNIPSYQKRKEIEVYFQSLQESTIKNYPHIFELIDGYEEQTVAFSIKLRRVLEQQKNSASAIYSLFTSESTKKLSPETYAQIAQQHDFESLGEYEQHHHDQQALQAIKNTYTLVNFSNVPMITAECYFDSVEQINDYCQKITDRVNADKRGIFKLMEIKNELNFRVKQPKLSVIVLIDLKTVVSIDILLYKDRDLDFEERFRQLNSFTEYSPLTKLKVTNQQLSNDLFSEMKLFISQKSDSSSYFEEIKKGFEVMVSTFGFNPEKLPASHPHSVDGLLLMPLYDRFTNLISGNLQVSREKDEAVYLWSNHKYRMAMGYSQEVMEQWNQRKATSDSGRHKSSSNLLLDQENSALQEQFTIFKDESQKYQTLYLSDLGLINEPSDPQKSIRYYRQTLTRQQSLHTSKTSFYTDLLNLIGRVHYSQEREPIALHYYQHNLNHQREIGGEKSEDYAITLSNIATIHFNNSNDKEALRYYEDALRVLEGLPGNKASKDATLLANLGTLYYTQKDYNKATNYFKRSLAASEQNNDTASSNYASCLSNMGAIFYHNKDWVSALDYYQKCRDIEERVRLRNGEEVDKDHPGSTYRNISKCLRKLGKHDQAQEYLRKSEIMNSELSSIQ